MTIHRVIVQIRPPAERYPGQISTGYYVVTDGDLIMVQGDGVPVNDGQFRCTLKPGDDPDAIARILTKQARRSMLGITEAEEAFGRPLNYADAGIA